MSVEINECWNKCCVEVCDELKYVMSWSCDEMWWDVMKNVSLTCHLIYYDEDVLRVCWNKSCDDVCENVLTYDS